MLFEHSIKLLEKSDTVCAYTVLSYITDRYIATIPTVLLNFASASTVFSHVWFWCKRMKDNSVYVAKLRNLMQIKISLARFLKVKAKEFTLSGNGCSIVLLGKFETFVRIGCIILYPRYPEGNAISLVVLNF